MHRAFCFFFLILISISAAAQQATNCQLPPAQTPAHSKNLFTDDQENELGNVVTYQFQQSTRIVEDPELTGYLQRVGDKLVRSLPPTGLHFQFLLMDLPEANAFSFPGGHVFVSRKLVSFLRSEDELAAILAHELGHIVTHQSATEMSAQMRRVLKIEHVETSEVFDRYNELLENWRRKDNDEDSHEDTDQIEADRMGIFTLARAGCAPGTMPAVFDRLAETKGKTGTWFSNLFGGMNPSSHRLREMAREAAALPPACVQSTQKSSPDDFKQWQSSVISYRGIGHRESLHGVVLRKKLQPSLRADLEQLRISPDGRYFLAQDEGSIVVFLRETMHAVLRISAERAHPAQFTPDSKHVSFYVAELASSPQVEVWDIEEQSQEVHEVYERNGCEQTALSSDGNYFACISASGVAFRDVNFDLRVRDVDSGDLVFEKKSFFSGGLLSTVVDLYSAGLSGATSMSIAQLVFSPDNRYLYVGRDNVALGVDLARGQPIPLDQNVKRIMRLQFAFLDMERMIGLESDGKADIVHLSDGKILAGRLETGFAKFQVAANRDFLILRPIKDHVAGVFDIKQNKIYFASKTSAVDLYENVVLRERLDGRIAVHSIADGKELALAPMLDTTLGALKCASMSGDMSLLALSGKSRGAVWDLNGDKRLFYTRGFDGAYFGDKNLFCADFPKKDETKRSIALTDFATSSMRYRPVEVDVRSEQFGRYLLVSRPAKKEESHKDVTLEVHDVCTDALLWSRAFHQRIPASFRNRNARSLVLLWRISDEEAKAQIRSTPQLQQRERELRDKVGAYYLELLDLDTGNIRARVLIDTGKGSFNFTGAFFSADRLFIRDNHERLLAFSLDGHLQGRVFGRSATISPDGNNLLVHNSGRLTVVDAHTMKQIDQLDFNDRIAALTFGVDPTLLTIITADQTLFRIDLKNLHAPLQAGQH